VLRFCYHATEQEHSLERVFAAEWKLVQVVAPPLPLHSSLPVVSMHFVFWANPLTIEDFRGSKDQNN
jgi:hypothetical protein